MLPTIQWKDNRVIMIDQRKLPAEESYIHCENLECVAESIEKMVIRGAPAIGVAAAFGVVLGMNDIDSSENLEADFRRIIKRLERTRPTARNLFWALERMSGAFRKAGGQDLNAVKNRLQDEALDIEREDVETNRNIGRWGQELISDGSTILTHCNAGALATAGYGTALGVIRSAVAEGKKVRVFSCETRPFLQGARLTVWELTRDNIPVTLITDNMAGHLMQKGEISLVITGADRIARNGDSANKIGTYSLAVLAKEHEIPFYIAAPMNTVDFSIDNGGGIPIEERHPDEVRGTGSSCRTLPDVDVRNPAFDVTPERLITAIITENGVARPPFLQSLEEMSAGSPC